MLKKLDLKKYISRASTMVYTKNMALRKLLILNLYTALLTSFLELLSE